MTVADGAHRIHREHSTSSPPRPAWFHRAWPAAAGVALAVPTAVGVTSGAELAPILTASGLVYLGAAALGRRGAAWPVFLVSFVVIAVAKAVGGPDATWVMLGLAAVALVYGLARGAARYRAGLPLQTAAMVVIGAVAAIAVLAGGDLSGYLVAAGLLGHAAWDVYHHRTGRVVARSMAEFCFVLDTLVAIVVLIVTIGS